MHDHHARRCSSCNEVILPVVAVDIDGTIAQYHEPFQNMQSDYFARPRRPMVWDGRGDFENYLELNREQFDQVKLAYRQGGFKRWAPPWPAALSSLKNSQKLLTQLGKPFELWLTTTRPYLRLDSIDPDTRFWLGAVGLKFDRLLYDEHKYLRLHEIVEDRLCCIVDDLPEMVTEGLKVCKRSYMVARQHNLAFRQDVPTVISDVFIYPAIRRAVEEWYG